jgi:hypothetical protein
MTNKPISSKFLRVLLGALTDNISILILEPLLAGFQFTIRKRQPLIISRQSSKYHPRPLALLSPSPSRGKHHPISLHALLVALAFHMHLVVCYQYTNHKVYVAIRRTSVDEPFFWKTVRRLFKVGIGSEAQELLFTSRKPDASSSLSSAMHGSL